MTYDRLRATGDGVAAAAQRLVTAGTEIPRIRDVALRAALARAVQQWRDVAEQPVAVQMVPNWRLSSLADVRRVCRTFKLSESGAGDEWADDRVHVWAQPNRPVLGASGPWCRQITVDVARPGHYCRVGVVFPDASAKALWHLIEVAREGCDVGEDGESVTRSSESGHTSETP